MEDIKVFCRMKCLIVAAAVILGGTILFPTVNAVHADDFWKSAVDGNIWTPESVLNIGVGTTNPKARFTVSGGAFLVEGEMGTIEGLDRLGMGPRLMWIPERLAFRVGNIDSAGCVTEDGVETCNWDSQNIGEESIGIGANTLANAHAAIALGHGAAALGASSMSIGEETKADSRNAIALGSYIRNNVDHSLMVGFGNGSVIETPALFADATGIIINGVPGEETRYPLAVRGTIKAEEIIVDTNWADYVFQDDYQPPSLDQVAAFIRENKRLPEMPSEARIKKEGLKMADMMALQMKKIEELTLYAIQLRRENDQLKQENNALKGQKDALQRNQQVLERNQHAFNRRLQAIETSLSASPVERNNRP